MQGREGNAGEEKLGCSMVDLWLLDEPIVNFFLAVALVYYVVHGYLEAGHQEAYYLLGIELLISLLSRFHHLPLWVAVMVKTTQLLQGMEGLRCKVEGARCNMQSFECKVHGAKSKVHGASCKV